MFVYKQAQTDPKAIKLLSVDYYARITNQAIFNFNELENT